jgi:predicted GIY-YIG superfamily endonuclease
MAKKAKKKKTPISETSGVYLIHDKNANLYKIGHSVDCIRRLKQHKTSNPDLILIGYIKTKQYKKLEVEIHNELHTLKYKPEWFILDERVYNRFILDADFQLIINN